MMETSRLEDVRDQLGERDLAVLGLMADGLSNQEIADRLYLALTTVKWYIRQINNKLNTHTRTQTIARAHQLNLFQEKVAPEPLYSPQGLAEPLQNPYKGLRAFQEADASDFYGREAFINQLLKRLSEQVDQRRFLAVIGPCGSGKSSVVNAGLIPALRQGKLLGSERWRIMTMFPGSYPLEELEAALLSVTDNPPHDLLGLLREDEFGLLRAVKRLLPREENAEFVLVLDQFEEMFTLVESETTRQHFLNSLRLAVNDPRSRLSVIITLRADFLDKALLYGDFARLLRQRHEFVVPLTADELKQAIFKPAARLGVEVEATLAAEIVHEVGQQPGTLPLLQYTMTELFERREGKRITLNAYRAGGGVMKALGRRADELYETMDSDGQTATRQLFLRLVQLGEGTEDTRRRVPLIELISLSGNSQVITDVINVYSHYRLLTLDHDPRGGATVEVAHEAMLRQWQRLRMWLSESRADVRQQRLLAAAAQEWRSAEQDPSFLLSGGRLRQFEEWVTKTVLALTTDERAYLDSSLAERERQLAAENVRQAHESLLERRARNFLRALVVVFALAAVLSGGLAFTANNQRIRAEAAEEYALRQASIGLAAQAELELVQGLPERAVLLSLEALENYPYTWQAERALFAAVQQNRLTYILDHHTDRVWSAEWSPDGTRLLTSSLDGTARIWDVETGKELLLLVGHSGGVTRGVWSPDGTRTLTVSEDGTARIWDARTGEALVVLAGHSDWVWRGVWSPDGRQVVSASKDGTAIVWDVNQGTEIFTLSHEAWVNEAAWSPDGKYIATASDDGTAKVWDAETGHQIYELSGHTDEVWRVAWSRDGTRLATAGKDGTIRVWDADNGKEAFVLSDEGRSALGVTVAWSPDGNRLLTVEDGNNEVDGAATIWDMTTGEQIYRLPGRGDLHGGAWSLDGTRVAVNDEGEVTRVWDARTGEALFVLRSIGIPLGVDWSPDSNRLVTSYEDGTVLVWDTTDPAIFAFPGQNAGVAAWSPDGKRFLRADSKGTVVISDTETGEPVMTLPAAEIDWASWSPDGALIGTAHTDGTGHIWDAVSGEERLVVRVDSQWLSLYWSPDSRQFALIDTPGGTAHIFDVATGERLHTLGAPDAGLMCKAVWSPDGTRLAAGREKGMIEIWDAATGEEILIALIEGFVCQLDWSPDGTRLVVPSLSGFVHIVNPETGRTLFSYGGHSSPVDGAWWSPDGRRVVSAGGTTRIWDPVTGAEYGVLSVDVADWQAHWSPDGTRMLTIGPAGVLRVWRVFPNTESLIAYARVCCVLRELTPEERRQFGLPER